MVALLRGVNVGGNRKVPMPELCKLATQSGLEEVESYINSGNLVFEAGQMKAGEVVDLLETAIEKHFGFQVDIVVRTMRQWKKYSEGSPFPDAERSRPNLLHLGLSKLPCKNDLAANLSEYAIRGEKIKVVKDAIWVDFAAGVGKSKLTPALFERLAGSPVTMRNWNTVLKLYEMLKANS